MDQKKWTFRRANAGDLPAVEAGYLSYLRWQAKQEKPWTVWKEGVYPTLATAGEAVEEGSLYLLEEDGALAASVILNKKQPPEYIEVGWYYPAGAEEVLVIHTLCVSPEFAGRGVGSRVVEFTFDLAREQGCQVVRLDTGGQNLPAVGLYTKLGFRKAGGGFILLDGHLPDWKHVFMEYRL